MSLMFEERCAVDKERALYQCYVEEFKKCICSYDLAFFTVIKSFHSFFK